MKKEKYNIASPMNTELFGEEKIKEAYEHAEKQRVKLENLKSKLINGQSLGIRTIDTKEQEYHLDENDPIEIPNTNGFA